MVSKKNTDVLEEKEVESGSVGSGSRKKGSGKGSEVVSTTKKKTEATVAKSKSTSAIEKRASKKLKDSVKEAGANAREVSAKSSKVVTSDKKNPRSRVKVDVKRTGSALVANRTNGKVGVVENGVARATGRRKRAIAKVICSTKTGAPITITVNSEDYKEYFSASLNCQKVYAPFALLKVDTGFIVRAEVFGGGKSGQADALKLGISRCLSLLSDEFNTILRKNSYLTRDSRIVEPKKAGLRKARKKEQFSKR